jgi:hypothetical protein
VVFAPSAEGALPRLRRALRWGMSVELGLVVAAALWGLSRPLTGWTQVPGTARWSNTSLTTHAGGRLAVTGNERHLTIGRAPLDGPAHTVPFPGGLGWFSALREDGTLWVAPRDDDQLWVTALAELETKEPRWRSVPHDVGDVRAVAVAGATVWLAGVAGVARLDGGAEAFRPVPSVGRARVVCAAGSRVLVAGRGVAFLSEDSGATFQPTSGLADGFPDCAVARDGWAYVSTGGLLRGSLFARPPPSFGAAPTSRGGFVERALPATDLRALAVNPDDGAEIVFATWGEGVFHSRDGGLTWEDLGLHGVEVRSLELSSEPRTLTVAGANLVGLSGLFRRPF